MSFDLDRFLKAQTPQVADVLAELKRGRKLSHWMWYSSHSSAAWA